MKAVFMVTLFLCFFAAQVMASPEYETLTYDQATTEGLLEFSEDQVDEAEVFQREYIYTQFNQNSAVQTVGLYTCIGLVVWDPQQRSAILAHIDAATNVEHELEKLRSLMAWERSDIFLIGGVQNSTRLRDAIVEKVYELGGNIKFAVQNNRGARGLNIRLDLSSGELSFFHPRYSTTTPDEARAKHDRIRGGSRLYRHLDSIGGGDPLMLSGEEYDPFDFLNSGI